MPFLNCTPHPINIFREEDVEYKASARKYIVKEGAVAVMVIPPSGRMLSAQMGYTELPHIAGVTVVRSFVLSTDEPPADAGLIVSRMYAAAAAARWMNPPEMYCVHNPVYKLLADGTTAPCGCLGLERI